MIDAKTWKKVRTEYLAGRGSCRELAEKYGINPVAVSSRARREGWRKAKKFSAKKYAVEMGKAAKIKATAEAETAKQVLDVVKTREAVLIRVIDEGNAWLDAIRAHRDSSDPADLDRFEGLVRSWQKIVGELRSCLGMGVPAFALQQNIHAGQDATIFTRELQDEAVEAWRALREEIRAAPPLPTPPAIPALPPPQPIVEPPPARQDGKEGRQDSCSGRVVSPASAPMSETARRFFEEAESRETGSRENGPDRREHGGAHAGAWAGA